MRPTFNSGWLTGEGVMFRYTYHGLPGLESALGAGTDAGVEVFAPAALDKFFELEATYGVALGRTMGLIPATLTISNTSELDLVAVVVADLKLKTLKQGDIVEKEFHVYVGLMVEGQCYFDELALQQGPDLTIFKPKDQLAN